MSGKALTGYRNVSVNYTALNSATPAVAAPLDFYKAVAKKVEELEYQYANNPTSLANITAATVLLTGKTPYKVYKATLTLVVATGVYTVIYVGTFANAAAANA